MLLLILAPISLFLGAGLIGWAAFFVPTSSFAEYSYLIIGMIAFLEAIVITITRWQSDGRWFFTAVRWAAQPSCGRLRCRGWNPTE